MRHDDRLSLQQMLDYANEAYDLVQDRAFAELQHNRLFELAVIRLLEILGEAANRVSTETQERYAHIPWGQLVSLRDRLIHGYDSVDLQIVWQILTSDLPQLVEQLEKIVEAYRSTQEKEDGP